MVSEHELLIAFNKYWFVKAVFMHVWAVFAAFTLFWPACGVLSHSKLRSIDSKFWKTQVRVVIIQRQDAWCRMNDKETFNEHQERKRNY